MDFGVYKNNNIKNIINRFVVPEFKCHITTVYERLKLTFHASLVGY
jgi:hypothetical protein